MFVKDQARHKFHYYTCGALFKNHQFINNHNYLFYISGFTSVDINLSNFEKKLPYRKELEHE